LKESTDLFSLTFEDRCTSLWNLQSKP